MSNLEERFQREKTQWSNPFVVHTSVMCSNGYYKSLVFPGKELRRFKLFTSLLHISGQGYTNGEGKMTFKLPDRKNVGILYVRPCGHLDHWVGEVVIAEPNPMLIVSPNSDQPVFLTWTHEAQQQDKNLIYIDLLNKERNLEEIDSHYDISFTVHAWNFDSSPAPSVSFGWICLAEGAGILGEQV